MYHSVLRLNGEQLCSRVDSPPPELDFEAELKILQASVKELQTENQGKKCVCYIYQNVRHTFNKVSTNSIFFLLRLSD